jgi:hypothetical protein
MDITIANKEENIKKDQKKQLGKGKKDDKKSKPSGNLPETRNRAKSTVVGNFEQKKVPNPKKELKPIETIGNERFKNLLCMFDKKPDTKENKEDTAPKKLDMSKFAFGQSENKDNTNSKRTTDIADGIKKRMESLMQSNKENSKSGFVDPILEQRRKQRELDGDDEEDDDDEEDEESEENLHISEDEDEHNSKDEEDKDENKSDEEKDVKIVDKDEQKKNEFNEEKNQVKEKESKEEHKGSDEDKDDFSD